MMTALYLVLGLLCFAMLLGLTRVVAHTETRE